MELGPGSCPFHLVASASGSQISSSLSQMVCCVCCYYWLCKLFPFLSLPVVARVSTSRPLKEEARQGVSLRLVACVAGPPPRTHSVLTSAEGGNVAGQSVSERDQPVAERFIARDLIERSVVK